MQHFLKNIKHRASSWFLSFLELQLVVSLLSLPLLTYWGLPVSYIGPLANIIFTPVLIAFLWISCIFALCTFMQLPCSIPVCLMNYIAHLWHYLLSLGQPAMLVGFSHQSLIFSIPICICIYILYVYLKPAPKHAISILLCFWISTFLFKQHMDHNFIKQIPNLNLVALKINNKNYLIDYGAFSSKQNFYNHIDYTILPQLIKTTGMSTIDTLILLKPHKNLEDVVSQFAEQTQIKTIIATTKSHQYNNLKQICENKSIILLPCTIDKPHKIILKKTKLVRCNAKQSTMFNRKS